MAGKFENKGLNLTVAERNRLFKKLNIKSMEELDSAVLLKLKETLKKITDTRQKGKISYKIWDIVCYVVVANFSSVYDFEEIHDFVEMKKEFFKRFLKMTGGIPHAITIKRVLSIINPKELEEVLTTFFMEITNINTIEKDILNFDGRVDKGSARNKTDYHDGQKPLNCLNVYSNNYGLCIGSEIIDEKTNEIPTIPLLIDRLKIADTIVTWDALNTQKDNIEKVIKAKADYVVPVKANQGNLFNELKLYFDDKRLEMIIAGNSNSAYKKEIEKSHSKCITYEYYQTSDTSWYEEKEKKKKLYSIGMVRKIIEYNGEITVENRYYISSLDIDINLFSKAIRLHWSVENKLHWHLDFTFREDKNTTANKTLLMNLQLINKFTLAVLNKVKPKYGNISLKRIRNIISLDFEQQFIYLLCYLMY